MLVIENGAIRDGAQPEHKKFHVGKPEDFSNLQADVVEHFVS